MVTLSVRVRKDQKGWLDRQADAAALIRDAVAAMMDKENQIDIG